METPGQVVRRVAVGDPGAQDDDGGGGSLRGCCVAR
jgi:hypothetical protein